jgi:hypothetical protein
MILLILIGALVIFDVLALYYGVDSRDLIDRDRRSRRFGLDLAGDAS